MIHADINLSRLMVFSQFIEESKLCMFSRILERGGSSGKNKPRFTKTTPIKDEPRDTKGKQKKGSGSQGYNPTCVTCGKRHY